MQRGIDERVEETFQGGREGEAEERRRREDESSRFPDVPVCVRIVDNE